MMIAGKVLSVFRSAISDSDGAVDAGYLGMFWVLMSTVGSIPLATIGLYIQQYYDEHHTFNIAGLGVFLGLAASAFGVASAAVGVFKRLDRPPAPPAGTVQKTDSSSTTITGVGAQA